MKDKLAKALAALAVASVLVLGLVAFGLVPAREPEPPRREPLEIARAVERRAPENAPEPAARPARRLLIWRLPVCDAPSQVARVYRVAIGADNQALLVWCKHGYTLVDLAFEGETPQLTRLAEFRARGELAGGAASGDFDADGVSDLVLGVAPSPLVVHQPGSGAFWVRGRREGGYAAPITLAEIPIAAVAPVDLDGTGASELLLLTRGDLGAQRPGELWLFAHGPALARTSVVPLGLDPRDLAVALGSDQQLGAFVALGQPGSLARVPLGPGLLHGEKPVKQVLPLPGAQGLVSDGVGRLLVRNGSELQQVVLGPEPALAPWAAPAKVGPSVLADFDGDGTAEVLAAMVGGFARAQEGHPLEEVALRDAARVFDVTALRDGERDRGLLLLTGLTDEPGLVLGLLPPPPWGGGLTLEVREGSVRDAASRAVLALE